MTPAQRSLRARIGALSLHASGGTSTAAGTAAFLSRFDRQVDPDGTLAPEERARRAAYARKAYFAALSLKASRARTTSRGPVAAGAEAARPGPGAPPLSPGRVRRGRAA